MKRLFLIALMAIPIIGLAQQKKQQQTQNKRAASASKPGIVSQQFSLHIKFTTEKPPLKAYLMYDEVLDSAMINQDIFQFKGKLTGPINARLIMDPENKGLQKLGRNADVLSFYLAPENISIQTKDSIKTAVITGSKINAANTAYQHFIAPAMEAIAVTNKAFRAAPEDKRKDPGFKKQSEERYEKAAAEKAALQTRYIQENPDSFFSLVALYEIAGSSMNVAKIEPVYKNLSPNLRESYAGQEFSKLIESARSISIGAMAPEFSQNDLNDKPVQLSNFRGKYVLIDFWASWCVPCRAENPNVLKAYNAYKDKNFTILGVSLDQPGKKEAWLEAIKADGLTWTQVSDLKFWDNSVARKYSIRSIPQNFLIDPSGKIIAKNLQGEALQAKLKELL